MRPLTEDFTAELGALEADSRAALAEQGIAADQIVLERRARLRFAGSDSVLTLDCEDRADMNAAFRTLHRQRFGYSDASAPIIVEALSVEASGTSGGLGEAVAEPVSSDTAATGGWETIDRAAMVCGEPVAGPVLVIDPASTTVVEPGWQAERAVEGSLILERNEPLARSSAAGTLADPVRLEIYNNLFMAIAEEMGVVLQSTATSVNIKERLDFSCALFDAAGELIANAPHIPVHLGSMGDSIRAILRRRGPGPGGVAMDRRGMQPGDVYALNAPYDGGTHLPDVTVIMPVFVDGRNAPAFHVAARGHHADIGGITPGSMPPGSRSVKEEGVILDNLLVVDRGEFREAAIRDLLGSGPYPARNIDQNIADLSAQIAACAKGAAELLRISNDYGVDSVAAYMAHVQDQAEAAVRRLIGRLADGRFTYPMDNGASVQVAVAIDADARSATIDFTGSSDQLPGNFNAPLSVVRAAVLYVVRTLIDEAVPMNDGCLKPITLSLIHI